MKKFLVLSATAITVAFLGAILAFSTAAPAAAQRPLPANNRAKGMVYDGLTANDPECKGNYKLPTRAKASGRCTHGPDLPPAGFDVSRRVAAVDTSVLVAYNSPDPQMALGAIAPLAAISCDGDGTSGKRVQVLYTHASDVADGYAAYSASFQQWVAGMDAIYNNSAAQTGGSRHIRFVHDANCKPVIPNVTLSPAGDESFLNTINELEAMGYNRTDRKYIIFMDARVYCGIATTSFDDSSSAANANNIGDSFGRIDAGCWSDVIPAHELMHQFGGVQLSAPHSSGESHCYDGYDVMCQPTNGTTIQLVCSNIAQGSLLDCGQDDYYSTNPPTGSYLALHWNSANSQFLMIPQTVRVDSILTGRLKGKTFTQSSTFSPGETVIVRTHVVDQTGSSLSGTNVTVAVNQPNGSAQCTFTATTDATGTAQGSCALPRKAALGKWVAHLNNASKSGYSTDTVNSALDKNFTVQ